MIPGTRPSFAGSPRRGEARFEIRLPNLRSALAHRVRAIVTISVTRALPAARFGAGRVLRGWRFAQPQIRRKTPPFSGSNSGILRGRD